MMRLDLQRPGDNAADVDVERLRVKVDWWHIRTVRNVGYCFSA
jgi:DNA-binding response OmpR family regulator